jgi:hypothetical protein
MKLLVTHFAPDLDAIASVWMLRRFDERNYADAKLGFVNPGETFDLRSAADLGFSPDDITHTDTGLGVFDHHQPERGMKRICATSLVFDYICDIHPEYKSDKALAYISEYVTAIDHFEENAWEGADDYKFQFMLQNIIEGLRLVGIHDDEGMCHFGFSCIDGVYAAIREQIGAQEAIEEKGNTFETKWGRALAIESANDETIKLGQKQGFVLVVRKDPGKGNIRIKAVPDKGIDLTAVADEIKSHDSVGTWYIHPAKTMLLNGSSKSNNQIPSPLTLAQVVGIIKQVVGKKS